ncbi:glycosyltransferase family 4 protein [Desulfohalovibrio reitneri]|uniref:glycosyltransferase family 4 protein n=1 Tax=Desulfohalovibrio reitneri TaxID=1307759 RepID=UPI00068F9632|nr:glycosyltransferase family 4 protein [Desulfohalovibrio reitneri]
MRLVHFFNSYRVGGVERQHAMLVEHLAPRFEQFCWSYDHGPIEDMLDGMGIEHVSGGPEEAFRLVERAEPDCLVIRTNRYARQTADFLSRRPAPAVYIRSYLRWWEGNQEYFDPELEALTYANVDALLFSGPRLRDNARRLDMGLPPGGILPNGLRLENFPMHPRRAGKPERLRVGMLANIAPHKNQARVIEVLGDDLRAGRCELVLAGKELFPDYCREVARAMESAPVAHLGYAADPAAFFKEVDVCLLASTHEGWPITLMEGMASGVPCVAPDIGDIPAVLDRGRAGLIYPEGEHERIPAILDLLRDPETYARFSREGVRRAGELDMRTTGGVLERTILESVASWREATATGGAT